MARSGVQYEDVQRAIDGLMARGEAPSVQKIRETLGTGSFTTISEHLREWRKRREENRDVPPPRGMPAALQELAESLWQQAQESANEALAHYRREADDKVADAREATAEAERQAEDAQQRESALSAHLARTEERLTERTAEFARLQADHDALESREARQREARQRLETRLDELQGELERQAQAHRQALADQEAAHQQRLAQEEQRHETAEARLMSLLDEARQERQAAEKAHAARQDRLEKRLEASQAEQQSLREELAEEQRRRRTEEQARRDADAARTVLQEEKARLAAQVEDGAKALASRQARIEALEQRLEDRLWSSLESIRETRERLDETAENDSGPASAGPEKAGSTES
ncbi:DNA-binding protein [Halomonas organivorans]